MSPFNKGPVTYQIERWEPSQRHWTRVASGVRDTNYQLTGLPFDQDHLFRIRAEAEKVLSEPTYPISFNRFRCKAHFYVLIVIDIKGFVEKNILDFKSFFEWLYKLLPILAGVCFQYHLDSQWLVHSCMMWNLMQWGCLGYHCQEETWRIHLSCHADTVWSCVNFRHVTGDQWHMTYQTLITASQDSNPDRTTSSESEGYMMRAQETTQRPSLCTGGQV